MIVKPNSPSYSSSVRVQKSYKITVIPARFLMYATIGVCAPYFPCSCTETVDLSLSWKVKQVQMMTILLSSRYQHVVGAPMTFQFQITQAESLKMSCFVEIELKLHGAYWAP